jgi:hypothetical protein
MERNILPVLHRLVTDELGENYWFNGSARYIMECLGEPDFDYSFFAGISGDNFTQIYYGDQFRGCCLTDMLLGQGDGQCLERLFEQCGYKATAVPCAQIRANAEAYTHAVMDSIDKGIPVAVFTGGYSGVLVGYEGAGEVLLLIQGNSAEPIRLSLKEATDHKADGAFYGWVFVGEKQQARPLKAIYREALQRMPRLLTLQNAHFSCGAQAFREWANAVEGGYYDALTPEEFQENCWWHYTNYVCVLATNACCCYGFLDKAFALNPDCAFIGPVKAQYRRMDALQKELEAIGGGFNVTLAALQDKKKRAQITAKLRACADCADEVVRIWKP